MTPELVLLLPALASLCALLVIAVRPIGVPPRSRPAPTEPPPAPFSQPLGIYDTDSLVMCPSCRCIGHHLLTLVPARPPAPIRLVEDPDRAGAYAWQSASGTPAHYQRQCLFCSHLWSVPA